MNICFNDLVENVLSVEIQLKLNFYQDNTQRDGFTNLM